MPRFPKNSRLVDLSWSVNQMTPIFPGDPAISTNVHSTVDDEGHAIRTWSSGMHVGTHLDAPAHFLSGGGDVASIDLASCIGDARVIRVKVESGVIPTKAIQAKWNRVKQKKTILLLHTGWSDRRFEPTYFEAFPGFDREFEAFIETSGIRLLGVDMPSVRFADGDYAGFHRMLLTKQIVIVENLIGLDKLPASVLFTALPLKLQGFDGSMVRACAIVKASSTIADVDNKPMG
jgi:kynurenine formamidase